MIKMAHITDYEIQERTPSNKTGCKHCEELIKLGKKRLRIYQYRNSFGNNIYDYYCEECFGIAIDSEIERFEDLVKELKEFKEENDL